MVWLCRQAPGLPFLMDKAVGEQWKGQISYKFWFLFPSVSLCFLQLTPCFSKAVISQKLAWGTALEWDGVTVCVNHTGSVRDYTIPPAALGRGITGNKHACCHLEMSEL